MIYAHHDGGIHVVFGWHGQDHFLRAGFEVFSGLLAGSEDAGGFHHVLHVQIFPGQGFRVFLGKDSDPFAVDDNVLVIVAHFALKDLVHTVVFEEVGQGLGIGEIVDRHHIHIRVKLQKRAQHQASDAAKSIDCYSCHNSISYSKMLLLALPETRQKFFTVSCILASPWASHLRGSNLLLLGT